MTDTVDRKANKNLLDENLKPGKLCVIRSNYTQTRQSLTKTSHVSGKSHLDLSWDKSLFEIVSNRDEFELEFSGSSEPKL